MALLVGPDGLHVATLDLQNAIDFYGVAPLLGLFRTALSGAALTLAGGLHSPPDALT